MTDLASSLRVFLTVDVGPDDAVLGKGSSTAGSWERTSTGLGVLCDVFRVLEDDFGIDLKATWFFRADGLIAEQFGDPLDVYERFSALREKLVPTGHEIGWMPQVYGTDAEVVNLDDLVVTHEALAAAGLAPGSTRMGNLFHDNDTMASLAGLGVRVDCSALPGRKRFDTSYRIDWRGTPEHAYHPSKTDYRVPGTPHLDILELPFTVVPVRAPYDAAPLLRYLNPCMWGESILPGLREAIESRDHIVCVLHPDEVVACKDGHPMIAYSAKELSTNLRELWTHAGRVQRRLTFETVGSFEDH